MLDPREFKLTWHFLGRALDMQLSPEQIEDVLLNPDNVIASSRYPGKVNYRKGDVTFGVNDLERPRGVITAVWSSEAAWDRDFERSGYADRQRASGFGVSRRAVG